MEQQAVQANYSGWTLFELYGHSHEAGFATTLYFGGTAMFQIDVPEIPAQEETLTAPRWSDDGDKLLPIGTVIQRAAIPGRSRMLGIGAVYSMHPATEDAVRAAISNGQPRAIKVLSIPPQAERTLLPGEPQEAEYPEDNDGGFSDDED